jgi:DNA-binding NarL/FixJ family response regulator
MIGELPPAEQSGLSRVLIADDHPLFREALRGMLSGQPDLKVVGEAADGQEAVELCRRLRPDLVLMDVRMPRMDGLAATRAIKQEHPHTIVLVLTALEEPNRLSEALMGGAGGYILKYESRQQILEAIRLVLSGEAALNPGLATRLLCQVLDKTPKKEEESVGLASSPAREVEGRASSPALESLTSREMEVLRLLARGKTNGQIAESLLLSLSTVKKHVHRVISKLGVSDRVQAAIRAIELGLLPEQEE